MIRITWWEDFKTVLSILLRPAYWPRVSVAVRAYEDAAPAECPACGYVGKFEPFGLAVRPRASCPQCFALERHRLFALGDIEFAGKSVLHFAPEEQLSQIIRSRAPKFYRTADLDPRMKVDRHLDIEAIDEADASYDVIVCCHVLEHVDDRRALAELFRILKPGGMLLAMVPIVEGWAETYENPALTNPRDRELHFGQDDHLRYYGADFRVRLLAAGFVLNEVTALGPECARYALSRGDKIFLAARPASE